jgi:hypothetical protein
MEYLDEKKPAPTKGINEDFGLHRNRPFFLVSRMFFHRVARTDSNNLTLVTLASNRKNLQQQFYFDETTKTIKSQ